MLGNGFCHTDAFIAAGVGCKNKKCPTINTSLFSTQPPPRRLLKKVIKKRNDDVDARIFHAVALTLFSNFILRPICARIDMILSISPQRKNKRRERMESAIKNKEANKNNFLVDETDEVEIRPILRRDAVRAGLDYWIDDGDFEKEKQRRIAVKNRKVGT